MIFALWEPIFGRFYDFKGASINLFKFYLLYVYCARLVVNQSLSYHKQTNFELVKLANYFSHLMLEHPVLLTLFEVEDHTVTNLKALSSSKNEPRGLNCGSTLNIRQGTLQSAILHHILGFVKRQMLFTVLLPKLVIHPWAGEDLSLKIDVGDQTIQICILELQLFHSSQMKLKLAGLFFQISTRWHWAQSKRLQIQKLAAV